jgi:UDP-glucose:glycoprotein glucosyltransferase
LTKEPKLARARQIPEWDVYDQEVAAFAKRIGGSAGKGLAGSVDALAGAAGQADDDTSAGAEGGESRRIEDEL